MHELHNRNFSTCLVVGAGTLPPLHFAGFVQGQPPK